MEFLTNMFVAGPSLFIVLCAIFATIHAYFKVYPVKQEDSTRYYVARNAKYLAGISLILFVVFALTSPINVPKNRVETLNEAHPITAEVVAGDAEEASKPFVDRVPKPKQREVFVHDMKASKNAE